MNLDWTHLHNFIKQQELEKSNLVVGLSGGVDSITLLDLFIQLRQNTSINFTAVHVNHGLNPNAIQWQQKIHQWCTAHQVSLVIEQVHIQAKSRTSLEHQARDARYQAIAECSQPNSVLFTGHHQSDQMETFLLRLMRGSGLAGLTSMRKISPYPHPLGQEKQVRLARPLLNVSKQTILDYAQTNKLTWVNDDSNEDDRFDRNFVRLSVLPQLFKRWSVAGKSINTATELLQQDFDLLNEYVEQDYLRCLEVGFNQHPVLNIDKLACLSASKQKAVIRMFVYRQLNRYPALATLNELMVQIRQLNTDSNIKLKVADNYLRTHKHHLYLVSDIIKEPRDLSTIELMVSPGQWYVLPENTLYQELKVEIEFDQTLVIKWARFSEMFQPNRKSGHKKLNKYLKEVGCPTWWRAHVPLIYINNQLIAVAGVGVSAQFTHSIHIELR